MLCLPNTYVHPDSTSRFPSGFMVLTLKIKIMTVTVSLIIITALVFGYFLNTAVHDTLEQEIDRRAMAIGRHFAELSAEARLTDSTSVLKSHLVDYRATEHYLAYIIITDGSGGVQAHTYGHQSIPADILEQVRKRALTKAVHLYKTADGQTLEDFYIPVGTGVEGGVHVGINEDRIGEEIAKLIGSLAPLLLLVMLGGVITAFVLSSAIVRPIAVLMAGVKRVTRGDLDVVIDVPSRDEIGQLADAFNLMTVNLRHSTVSREFMDNVINTMNDMLVVIAPDGTIQSVNRAFCEVFGYQAEEIVGHRVDEFEEQDAPRNMFAAFERTIRDERVSGIESACRTVWGSSVPMLFSMAVMKDDDDHPLAVICAAQDISGIKRAQLALELKQTEMESLNSKLEEMVSSRTAELAITNEGLRAEVAERMRTSEELRLARDAAEDANKAKSEFLANMSHEMRTPLNSIIGGTEYLENAELHEDQRRCLEMIHQAGEALLVQVNDLIDLSRIEAGQLELVAREFSLPDLLDRVMRMLSSEAGRKQLELSLQTPTPLPQSIVGDQARLQQVLVNLVGNAVKFTGHGGRVSLSVQAESQENGLVLITFLVRDTGIGIDPAKIDIIFETFAQADSSITRRFGGSGLGLAISKRLVEAMQGHILVESVPGVGSSFSFTLIFSIAPAAAPAAIAERVDQPALLPEDGVRTAVVAASVEASNRILLVDDSVENRELLRLFLSQAHVMLDEARDGQEALNLFERNRYVLVLMDIQMPVMDGYTATRIIRRIEERNGLPRTPVIALTAHAYEADIRKCLEAGCDDHIAKPFKKRVLFSHIGRYVEGFAHA